MKSNLSRLFKGLLTGGLAFGSVLLQAEGYGPGPDGGCQRAVGWVPDWQSSEEAYPG
jgi:hypothetical protein